ncbi:protein of unknown function (DUF3172) [Rubidibacter lacunae KORDI 51-2]|uniref:DUF3172 domain-containing protein n=1 Tax=Rubidibacter lacunae KORDI 51-2 TaxID=582515 RepID=U5DH23_9CHRO|nr:DUF3172 domain-containing protein [Rubidibacter lacunae]ERN40557.1 protein of unknown function (DUF3172) [Rubidibacter lacunae KORDI 51-2]
MARRPAPSSRRRPGPPPPRSGRPPERSAASPFNYTTLAVLLGAFIIGIGVGIIFSTSASFSPSNVVSREVIDRSAPNPEFCAQYGASAVVTDMRVFLTFNPFSVYVTQPAMQPGCVMRRTNWTILEKKNLIDDQQVRDCKQRLNTFGFVGNLEGSPRIDCIYQNDSAGNLFTSDTPGGSLVPKPETDRF